MKKDQKFYFKLFWFNLLQNVSIHFYRSFQFAEFRMQKVFNLPLYFEILIETLSCVANYTVEILQY